jgi:hypothetical protein
MKRILITLMALCGVSHGALIEIISSVDGAKHAYSISGDATLSNTGVLTVTSGGGSAPFIDSTAIIKGSADATKLLKIEVDGFTTGTTRVLTAPNFDGTIATLAGTESFTNKTLTNPLINDIFATASAREVKISTGQLFTSGAAESLDWENLELTGAWTMNAGAIFYVGASGILTSAQLATAITNETGSGLAVFATSPTLTTPALGAATATSLTYTDFLKSTTAFATPSALSATQYTAFASTVSGAAIMGYGTTNDVSLMNRSGTVCLGVGPNTTAINIPGALTTAGGSLIGALGMAGSYAQSSLDLNVGVNGLIVRSGGKLYLADGSNAVRCAIYRDGASTGGLYFDNSGNNNTTFRWLDASSSNRMQLDSTGLTIANALAVTGDVGLGKTITAAGTTGAQTINKTSGAVNFAASATSLVVTNSLVTTSSVIHATVGTNDTTMKDAHVVAASGSFTIYPDAAPTAETRVNFLVTN